MRNWLRGLGAALVAGGIAAPCLILPAATAQAAQNSQGGCTTYTVQGYNVGVCVNDHNTGSIAYPDIWVNKSAGSGSNCGINLSVWDDHTKRYTSKELSCGTGEQPGTATTTFSSPTLAHAYARLDLNGKAYPIGNSPSIYLDSSQPTNYWAGQGTSMTDPINMVVIVPGGNALSVLHDALLSKAASWYVNTCYDPRVWFNPGDVSGEPNASYTDNNKDGADVTPWTGCGNVGVTRDHLRVWANPVDDVLYIAASTEDPTGKFPGLHTVVSFDDGAKQLVTALAKGIAATGKHHQGFLVQRYAAGSVNGVKYSGQVTYFDVS
jgi:hypothetical protein